jgi:C1A family cysteine protease
MTRALGWTPPTLAQQVRALRRSSPEAGDSVLAGIDPAPASDISGRTCDLDQGSIGSCQSNATAQALYVAMVTAAMAAFVLARLWLYRSLRYIENTLDQDAGGNIGDAFAMLAAKGVPPETAWPYDVAKFKDDPGPAVDRLAYDSRGTVGLNYHPISTTGESLLADVERALTGGFAVVFGCTVSEAFCSTQPSGTVQAPGPKDKIAGRHALTVVGHDRAGRRLKIKNSWSDLWGDPDAGPGCFWMDYSYFSDSMYGASDIWIVTVLPGGIGQ